MTMTDDLLAESAYYDIQNLAEHLDRPFVDADVVEYKHSMGLDLPLGALYYTKQYSGNGSFMRSMKQRVMNGGTLTAPMVRAICNCIRQEVVNKDTEFQVGDKPRVICGLCSKIFDTWDELEQHKYVKHFLAPLKQEPVAEKGDAAPVIEVTKSTLGLDLSGLPDGRYAVPDPSGKNDYIFLMVKRVRRTHNRDRRYVFGKIITGNEVVVAGTIEVKIWSSDSKRLIGEQKPGDVYRGKYEQELQLIMLMPEPWAKLFGVQAKRCCICGKTLTDDESRAIGMGLECEKKEHYFRQPPKYTFIGADRPDKHRADPNDDMYLSGTWTTYRKFNPPIPAGQEEIEEDADG